MTSRCNCHSETMRHAKGCASATDPDVPAWMHWQDVTPPRPTAATNAIVRGLGLEPKPNTVVTYKCGHVRAVQLPYADRNSVKRRLAPKQAASLWCWACHEQRKRDGLAAITHAQWLNTTKQLTRDAHQENMFWANPPSDGVFTNFVQAVTGDEMLASLDRWRDYWKGLTP